VTALLTHDQAAARIGVCAKTLRQLRKQGMIRYVAVTGRKIFYRPEDCDAFLESRVTVDVPAEPTHRRRGKRLRNGGNVVSFMDRRRERQAAGGR
jgi:excisionase family DNA binding protein